MATRSLRKPAAIGDGPIYDHEGRTNEAAPDPSLDLSCGGDEEDERGGDGRRLLRGVAEGCLREASM